MQDFELSTLSRSLRSAPFYPELLWALHPHKAPSPGTFADITYLKFRIWESYEVICIINHNCDHNLNLFTWKCLTYKLLHWIQRNTGTGDIVLTSGSSTELQYHVVCTNSLTCHGPVEEAALHKECSPRRIKTECVSSNFWAGKVEENQAGLVASI